MKVIEFERHDHDFFCPVTGRPVYDQGGSPNTPAFRGLWINEILDEPVITDPELKRRWEEYVDSLDEDEDFVEMDEFLRSIDRPGWVAFEIITSGFACGPVSETTWTVLDLQHGSESLEG